MAHSLDETEESILELAARDRTRSEIANELGLSEKTIRNRISSICQKLRVHSLYGATALYANALGLHGELIAPSNELEPDFEHLQIAIPKKLAFRYGSLLYLAVVVSSEMHSVRDAQCILDCSHDLYYPPSQLQADLGVSLEVLRNRAVEEAMHKSKVIYEMPAGVLGVLSLHAANETYSPLTLTLRRIPYYTLTGVKDRLTLKLRQKYMVDPFVLQNPVLPLALSVCMHIIAGSPPQLIVAKRMGALGTYSGFAAAAVEALGDTERDVIGSEGQRVFDIARAMVRELSEERYRIIPQDELIKAVQMLGLVFDYRVLTYILVGYMWLRDADPKDICEVLSQAKEASYYEALPFPERSSDRNAPLAVTEQTKLDDLCRHLLQNQWTPCSGIGIVILLQRQFGVHNVRSAFRRASPSH